MATNTRYAKRNGMVDKKKFIKTMNDNNYLKKKIIELQVILAKQDGELKEYQDGYKNLAKDHNRLQQEIIGAQGMLWCLAYKNEGEILVTDKEIYFATLKSEDEIRRLKSSRTPENDGVKFVAVLEKKIDLEILKKVDDKDPK